MKTVKKHVVLRLSVHLNFISYEIFLSSVSKMVILLAYVDVLVVKN